jgi:hypothetical protein
MSGKNKVNLKCVEMVGGMGCVYHRPMNRIKLFSVRGRSESNANVKAIAPWIRQKTFSNGRGEFE